MTRPQRNAARVKSHLTEVDNGVVTDHACKIQIPERYLERSLASQGSEIYIIGIFALIMDDGYYAVSIADAMLRLLPANIETVEGFDGMSYMEFHFDAGDQVFYSLDLVQNDTLTYYIYDEIVAKGRVPWYLNYFDLARLFETMQEHAAVNLGNQGILNLIISSIARAPDDLTVLYKHVIEKPSDILTRPPAIIPFRSVIYNTTNTTSRLIGAHFGDAVTSALINPSDRVERIEELLRT